MRNLSIFRKINKNQCKIFIILQKNDYFTCKNFIILQENNNFTCKILLIRAEKNYFTCEIKQFRQEKDYFTCEIKQFRAEKNYFTCEIKQFHAENDYFTCKTMPFLYRTHVFILFLNVLNVSIKGVSSLFSAVCSLMFPSFHVFGTKVRQFPIKARRRLSQSIILEGMKSAACQISLCRK